MLFTSYNTTIKSHEAAPVYHWETLTMICEDVVSLQKALYKLLLSFYTGNNQKKLSQLNEDRVFVTAEAYENTAAVSDSKYCPR